MFLRAYALCILHSRQCNPQIATLIARNRKAGKCSSKVIDLKDEQGNELFDINEEPFKRFKARPWKLQKTHYKKEIQRCYESQDNSDVSTKAPGCAKWTSAALR